MRNLLRILNNWRYLHFKHKWVFVKSQGMNNYHFCDKCPTMLITSLYYKPRYVRGFGVYRKLLEFKNFEWERFMHYYDTNDEKLAKIYSKKWGKLSDIKHHWKWKYNLPLIRLNRFLGSMFHLTKYLYKYIYRKINLFIRNLIPKLSPRYFKSKKNLNNLKTSMNGFVEPSNYIHFVDPDLLKGNGDTIVTLVELPYTDWEISNIKIVDETVPDNK